MPHTKRARPQGRAKAARGQRHEISYYAAKPPSCPTRYGAAVKTVLNGHSVEAGLGK